VGIFNKSNEKTTKESGPTIISQGTRFIGGLSTNGIVHVDGYYEGVILQADLITIARSGKFVGDIKSNNVVISGYFDGKIDCDEIHIVENAIVIGEVRYNNMCIDPESRFEGISIKKDSKLISNYHQVENKINSIINENKQFEGLKREKA